jgi:hypothetical protein
MSAVEIDPLQKLSHRIGIDRFHKMVIEAGSV